MNLEYLDLSNFDTSNVTDMRKMFKHCYKLKQIKGINNFNISKLNDMEEMFEKCNSLDNLVLSKYYNNNKNNKTYKEKIKEQLYEERTRNLQL